MLVNAGLDAMAGLLGGDVAGFTGTASGTPTATTLTATGTPFVASAYIGHIVVASTSGTLAYGIVTANTTSVLTIDQWYAPASPGGAATTTPGTACTFAVLPGNAPYWYMALDSVNTAPGHTDTTLNTEIVTSGGGLVRALTTYAYTAASGTSGSNTYTLSKTFTANGTDSLPITVYNVGIFNTKTSSTGRMMFKTALSASATLSASGDAVTVTSTITV